MFRLVVCSNTDYISRNLSRRHDCGEVMTKSVYGMCPNGLYMHFATTPPSPLIPPGGFTHSPLLSFRFLCFPIRRFATIFLHLLFCEARTSLSGEITQVFALRPTVEMSVPYSQLRYRRRDALHEVSVVPVSGQPVLYYPQNLYDEGEPVAVSGGKEYVRKRR